MNKILLNDDKATLVETDELINVTISYKELINIKIDVLDNTKLNIEMLNVGKVNFLINLKENVMLEMFSINNGKKEKIQYKFNLNENSRLNITKFYDVNKINELDVVNLNGTNANIEYKLKTISKDTQKFDFIVYHNNKNTFSNIIHSGANILDGELSFNITGIVYNNVIDCELKQDSRIINFNDKKCNINPNLLIEENDVVANHSALIGKFSDDEIFYLMSRGIPREQAINLLVKGFLLDGIEEKNINKIIDRYWG